MLRHLCHHIAEPALETKLISIVDIYAYCIKFGEEIDWNLLKYDFPLVENTLRCLHYVSPIPTELHKWVAPPTASPPSGIGFGIPTLSSVPWSARNYQRSLALIKKIIWPPAWWLHMYYVVPVEKRSLTKVRCIRHWGRVCFWMYNRIRSVLHFLKYHLGRRFAHRFDI